MNRFLLSTLCKSILERTHILVLVVAVLLTLYAVRITTVADSFLTQDLKYHQQTRGIIKINLIFQRGFGQASLALKSKDNQLFNDALDSLEASFGYLGTSYYLRAADKLRLSEKLTTVIQQFEELYRVQIENSRPLLEKELGALDKKAAEIFELLSEQDQLNWQRTIADSERMDRRFQKARRYLFFFAGFMLITSALLMWALAGRKRAELVLQQTNSELEGRIKERTLELTTANRVLESLFETAPSAIVKIDRQGNVSLWNASAEELFGWSKAEIIGTRYPLVPQNEVELEGGLRKRVFAGEILRGVEVRRQKKDGSTIEALLSAAPLFDEQGKITGGMGIMEDITERKRMEQELHRAKELAESANHAKGMFLANMSHEIRTPMNGVIGMTDLVLDSELSEDQRECLEMASASARSLLSLLNDLLDFSKIEMDKLLLETIDFDLSATVRHALNPLMIQARQKGIELFCDIDASLAATYRGDPGRLQQVLINLVGNALKFTEQGSINVVVRSERNSGGNSALHFSIRDSGIGIPANRLEQIFESFAQVDGSVTRKFGGTGLGLAISKELVTLMDGEIWVESTPGQGSTFHFRMPMQIGKDALLEPSRNITPPIPPTEVKLHLLLAEDNPVNQQLILRLLTKAGHLVTVAKDGQEAVDALKTETFDLVLMDIQMPNLDGLQATQLIRSGTSGVGNPQVPIIALTAHAMKGDRERFLAAGMDGYISKPVDARELFDVIASFCSASDDDSAQTGDKPLDSNVLDFAKALKRLDNDRELLEELVEAFLSSVPGLMNRLQDAVRTTDYPLIQLEAHSLKGAAAAIGAQQLQEAALSMENAGAGEQADKCLHLTPQLEKELAAVFDHLGTDLVEGLHS